MKIRIEEEMWGINSRTGKSSVRKILSTTIPCEIGLINIVFNNERRFIIDKIDNEEVTITMKCKNEKFNKTWIVTNVEGVFYRPLSFDGGYQYRIKLIN